VHPLHRPISAPSSQWGNSGSSSVDPILQREATTSGLPVIGRVDSFRTSFYSSISTSTHTAAHRNSLLDTMVHSRPD